MPEGLYANSSQGLLKPLMPWMKDPSINEILINKPKELWVERNGKLETHYIDSLNSYHLTTLFNLIAKENKKIINDKNPILTGNLFDGSRCQIIIPPVSNDFTLSIRRNNIEKKTLGDYENQKFFYDIKPFELSSNIKRNDNDENQILSDLFIGKKWKKFIENAIQFKKNIIISGGTSTGKTTFLNTCLNQIHKNERIITIEDSREVITHHPNQVNLISSSDISMQDLLQTSLRLRPDRIIVGEIRGKEVLNFLSACSTGHSGSITSLHATNPRVAFMRMSQMYKLNNVPSMSEEDINKELHEVVDVIIQLKKDSTGRCIESIYFKH